MVVVVVVVAAAVIIVVVTYAMEKSLSWKTNSNQKILRLLWNTKIHRESVLKGDNVSAYVTCSTGTPRWHLLAHCSR
jgi:hypothetical protein